MIPFHNLTPANNRYYKDLHRFQIIAAGRRSRKSLIGSRKLLLDPGRGALVLEGYKYIQAAPTHAQAKSIFWNGLKANTKPFWSKKPSETDLTVFLFTGSQVQVIGLDKPERLEGQTFPPIKGIHITEMGNCKPELWGNNIRPILADNDGFAIIDGVPEGLNHYHDMTLNACGGQIPETLPILGAYAENGMWSFHSWFSSDILSQDEIEEIKKELDERTYKQEMEGQFLGLGGLAYYAYSEKNHTDKEFINGYPLAIGADFNVNPMCWGIGHIIDNAFYQIGEAILTNSNTAEMCEHVINKYNLKPDYEGKLNATVFPDSSANSRSTNATLTDIQIMKKYGFNVKAKNANPLQRNRIKNVNSAMNPMMGIPKYFVNPKNCKKTCEDWVKVQATSDGRLDKTQEVVGKPKVHISDAVGYAIDYNFPIRTKRATKMY